MQKKIIRTKNIRILTKIPAPGTNQLFKKLSKVELDLCMDNYQ